MGQVEEASVAGGMGAGCLAEVMWVEPEGAGRGQGGGVRVGAQSGLVDDLLTVLQVRTSERQNVRT